MNRVLQATGIAIILILSLSSLVFWHPTPHSVHLSLHDITSQHPTSDMTIQPGAQQIVAKELRLGIQRYKAGSGTALLLNSRTGEIAALASYATDAKTETLEEITQPYEPGSVMKPLLVAAALDSKTIDMSYRYYDKDWDSVAEKLITNSHRYDPSERSLQEIITLSLNTGAVSVMRQMGGGTVNKQARSLWHQYLVDHYHFGNATFTGVGADAAGFIPPVMMPGAASRYAQTGFGVGVTITPVQLAAAYAAVTSDGQLKSPCLSRIVCQQQSQAKYAVSTEVAANIRTLLIASLKVNNPAALYGSYTVGGKSGTAPIALSGGVYRNDVENGTYIGFFGDKKADYVLFVRLQEPAVDGYAGAAAAHVWADMIQILIAQWR